MNCLRIDFCLGKSKEKLSSKDSDMQWITERDKVGWFSISDFTFLYQEYLRGSRNCYILLGNHGRTFLASCPALIDYFMPYLCLHCSLKLKNYPSLSLYHAAPCHTQTNYVCLSVLRWYFILRCKSTQSTSEFLSCYILALKKWKETEVTSQ